MSVKSQIWPAGSADARVREAARAYGFDAVGVARADVPLDQDFARYEAFVAAGMHGEMDWLARDAEVRRRVDTADVLPGARSVVCVARRYARPREDEAQDPETARAIARYARGRDYHNGVRKKLRQLAAFVRRLGTPEAPVHARPLVDDAPILERAWAARAGLGFVGKNGLLIVPGQGSLLLLGEVVTTLALTPDAPMAERCGSCTRCLDACPTGAFPRPFVLDARRCVSYLTIELRGPIPEELREGVGDHVFGCDDCQTVCPFNQSPPREVTAAAARFAPHPRWATTSLEALLEPGDEAWARVSEGSPVHRATQEGLARNAAIVLGNRGDPAALGALERAREGHPMPVVREAAGWAAARLRAGNVLGKR
jgi:epoxyqueuosine reductase